MEKDWILLHFDATFDPWSAAGRKEHISLKNKEINQSAAHGKYKKAEIRRSAEKWHPCATVIQTVSLPHEILQRLFHKLIYFSLKIHLFITIKIIIFLSNWLQEFQHYTILHNHYQVFPLLCITSLQHVYTQFYTNKMHSR